MSHFQPGTVWLITTRAAPAWKAALHLLDDDRSHPIDDVAQTMRAASDLAPRTIENHLRSASRRRWITIRRGSVSLRERRLIETALALAEFGDGAR